MGGGEKFKVPHWKIYKIDGIPALEKMHRLLKAQGLRDPWIRNEVWRYTKENYGGQYRNAVISLGRGLKWALLAMGVTITLDALGYLPGSHKGHHTPPEEDDEFW